MEDCKKECKKQEDISDWQTYQNEEFGFGVVFDEEYKNIWESKTTSYTNENILARTDFYFKDYPLHIFSSIAVYEKEWFIENSEKRILYKEWSTKNNGTIEEYNKIRDKIKSEFIREKGEIAWLKGNEDGYPLGTYLEENNNYVFVLGIGPNGCMATELLCSLPIRKMTMDFFQIIDTNNDWQIYRNEEFGFEFKYPSEFFPQKVFQIEPDGMIFSVGNTIYNFSVSRYSEKYVSEKKAIYTEEYCSRDAGYNDCMFWTTWLNEWNGDSKIFISKSNGDNCKEESDNYKSRCFSCDVVLFGNEKAIEKIIFPLPNEDYFHWRLTVEKGSSHFYLDLASNFHELTRKEGVISQDFSLQQLILNQKDKEAKEIFNKILSTFKFVD